MVMIKISKKKWKEKHYTLSSLTCLSWHASSSSFLTPQATAGMGSHEFCLSVRLLSCPKQTTERLYRLAWPGGSL